MNCVYMVADGNEKVKIGLTSNLKLRISSIQTGNPNELKILTTFPVYTRQDATKLEAGFHRLFSNYKISGEWYQIDPVKDWLSKHKDDYADSINSLFGIWIKPEDDSDLTIEHDAEQIEQYLIKAILCDKKIRTADSNHYIPHIMHTYQKYPEKVIAILCTVIKQHGSKYELCFHDNGLSEETLDDKRCKFFLTESGYLQETETSKKMLQIDPGKFMAMADTLGYEIKEEIADYDLDGNYSDLLPEIKEEKKAGIEYYNYREKKEAKLEYIDGRHPAFTHLVSRDGYVRLMDAFNVIGKELNELGFTPEFTGTEMILKHKSERIRLEFQAEEEYKSVEYPLSAEQKQILRTRSYHKVPKRLKKYNGNLKIKFRGSRGFTIRDKENHTIEEQLPAFVERVIADIKSQRLENQEREKEETIRFERQKSVDEEYRDTVELCRLAQEYDAAEKLRKYGAKCEGEYQVWVFQKANFLDPFVKDDEKLLTQQHKMKLLEIFNPRVPYGNRGYI